MKKKNMYSTPVIVLAVFGACIALIMNCVSLGTIVKKSVTAVVGSELPSADDSGGRYQYETDPYGEAEEVNPEDLEGVDAATESLAELPSYEAEETSISYRTESYRLRKQFGNNGVVYLNIQYPVLSGMDEALMEKVNASLEDVAMVTADRYYLNVEERSKISGESGQDIYIVSEVSYHVTYLDDSFLSVVYEDDYCSGDYNTHYMDMRSCNIDLKTGKAYELKDIVNADSAMAKDYQQRLDDKYQKTDAITDIDQKEYEAMLKGEMTDGGSFMGFYRTKDGAELYMTFHFVTEESYYVGWLTAPYNEDEIQMYANDSAYWNIKSAQ